MPTGQVARSINLSPSILGRIAGSLWVDTADGRADIGLCVKNAPKAICVPDYAMPSQNEQGWVYTDALVQILTQYKVLTLPQPPPPLPPALFLPHHSPTSAHVSFICLSDPAMYVASMVGSA